MIPQEAGGRRVSDQYIPTWEGWVFLATVIDCHTKAVTGWAMDDNYKTPLIETAIEMSARNHSLAEDAIFHSDRGSNGGFNWSSHHFDLGGVRRGHGGLEFEDQRCSGGSASAVAR